jgi:hypothetical protein
MTLYRPVVGCPMVGRNLSAFAAERVYLPPHTNIPGFTHTHTHTRTHTHKIHHRNTHVKRASNRYTLKTRPLGARTRRGMIDDHDGVETVSPDFLFLSLSLPRSLIIALVYSFSSSLSFTLPLKSYQPLTFTSLAYLRLQPSLVYPPHSWASPFR